MDDRRADDAPRFRDKLRGYYGEFPRDPIVISLPKGSYVPVFEEDKAILMPPLANNPESTISRDRCNGAGWYSQSVFRLSSLRASRGLCGSTLVQNRPPALF